MPAVVVPAAAVEEDEAEEVGEAGSAISLDVDATAELVEEDGPAKMSSRSVSVSDSDVEGEAAAASVGEPADAAAVNPSAESEVVSAEVAAALPDAVDSVSSI